MLLSNFAIFGKKNSTFIKNQELLNDQFKINKIINKFLLSGENFIPELQLKQPGFTYGLYGLTYFMGHLVNIVKEFKNLEKHVIYTVYREMNQTKLVFLMMLHILIVKIQQRKLFKTTF